MNCATATLSVNGLCFAYGPRVILEDLDLEISADDVVVIMGENGSGKTTLLDILFGFVAPSGGSIAIDGVSLARIRPVDMVRRGFVRTFQKPRVFSQMTVLDCLRLAQRGMQLPAVWANIVPIPSLREDESRRLSKCMEALQAIEWHGMEQIQASELSYGQRKLLSLCQACLSPASAMILDEPFAGMDDAAAHTSAKLLGDWIRSGAGRCVLMTSHERVALCDIEVRTLRLSAGRLIADTA